MLKSIAKEREARRKLLKAKQDEFEAEAEAEMVEARLPKPAPAKKKKDRRIVSIVSDTDTDSDSESDESTASEEFESKKASSSSDDDADDEQRPLGPAVAPPGYSIVSRKPKTVTRESLLGKKANKTVLYKYMPASGPRGWFRGTIIKRALTAREKADPRGFTVNMQYTPAGTKGQLHGTVATTLTARSYGEMWVFLQK